LVRALRWLGTIDHAVRDGVVELEPPCAIATKETVVFQINRGAYSAA